jgi:glycosyltransferase involved in cell wall biosynthesis
MRIAYITAGAGGMYCGSCLRDNTLVSALIVLGHDALLIPTYTPIRTDEEDVSLKRVFFGGINVYLQQKWALFRHTPWFVDRLLDAPGLLRWVSRFAVGTRAEDLGELTVSMLKGEDGRQRKEVDKLVRWLSREVRPQLVNLTAVLLSGLAPELKARLGVPVLATLQGDDVFLDALPEPHRGQALALIRKHCREISGFIATSRYYADHMAHYFDIPRDRIHVVYPGLNLTGHGALGPSRNGAPFTIGYFARICREKGLHVLIDAYRILRRRVGAQPCRLRVSGWLGAHHQAFFDEQRRRLREWRIDDQFEHVESPDHAAKVRFLQSIDVLSVPTVYREPKGLYVLEALANGVPVVQPRHGSFPELIEATGGGLLVNPEDAEDLARALQELMNPSKRGELGGLGQRSVREKFTAAAMAARTIEVYSRYLARGRG